MPAAEHSPRGRFLRVPDVVLETGLSRATIYRKEAAGKFPRRRRLSENAVGWWSADVDQWKQERRAAPG